MGNALVEHPDVAMITLHRLARGRLGHPGQGAAQEGGARAGQQHAGDHRARRRLGDGGRQDHGGRVQPRRASRASRRSGCTCTPTSPTTSCDALAKRVGALLVGDPLDDATDVSSLISEASRDRVEAWIDEAVAAGAEVLAGGEINDGLLGRPCCADVTPDMKVCAAEVFGPVVGVQTYTDLDDALELANSTTYGLQAGIFTADLDAALRAARALDFGGDHGERGADVARRPDAVRGVRDSGNTKEGPAYTVRGDDRATPGGAPAIIAATTSTDLAPMLATLARALPSTTTGAGPTSSSGTASAPSSSSTTARCACRAGRAATSPASTRRWRAWAPRSTERGTCDAVLDGEVVALGDDGTPSFQTLQRRMHVVSPHDVRLRMSDTPVIFLAFDLLRLDGSVIVERPYTERRARLEALDLSANNWQTPPSQVGDGQAVLDVSNERGLEGVVAKRLDSAYEPGRRSRNWLKIKNKRRELLVIGGWAGGRRQPHRAHRRPAGGVPRER